jgi:uracil-DNA glycosylase
VFGHGAHVELEPARSDRRALHVFGSYHVSQQNTFTGRLTPAMIEDVLRAAATAAGLGTDAVPGRSARRSVPIT